jgi:N6-adenosine-specific RNA methylase IME4
VSRRTASGLSPGTIERAKTSTVPAVERWEARGRRIWEAVNRSAWELGDWWNAGVPYGDRVEVAERVGFVHQSCRNAGAVSVAFGVSRRRDTLSWGHHAEVARFKSDEQDAWLDKAEANGWTREQLRVELRSLPSAERPALPAGTFDVLLADPPWRYEDVKTASRAVENHYPTMDVEDIAALEVPAAADALLFLWATSPKLAEAIGVLEAWGFDYRTNLVWVKDRIGMGFYARQRHELLLVGRRGDPGVPDEADRPDSVIEAPRLEHSAKPSIVHDLIETMYPGRSYCELFARTPREGWTSWGNEVTE